MESKKTVSVFGMGFVGGAVARGLNLFANIKTYDIDPKRSSHTFEESMDADFVFMCLPTPMVSAEGGECDLSIVESAFERIVKHKDRNQKTIFIIKSTVPVGTTASLVEKFNLPIVHNPEFLTARSALIDFLTPARNIVGGQKEEWVNPVYEFLVARFPGVPCYSMTSNESEMVKYVANCFFATKVLYFNEQRLLCDKLGLNWNKVIQGVLSDGRIAKSHYEVPGHDGDRGFGGFCVLPEAIVAITKLLDDNKNKSPDRKNNINNLDRIPISVLFNQFKQKKEPDRLSFKIESCDADINKEELKIVTDVTTRDVSEEIYHFDTENGIFRCTAEHLMPVQRDGKQILIQAKNIKETDKFYSK